MKIAIAHDYLTQRGGAERVVLSMLRAFPGAPVHTSLYDAARCFSEYRSVRVHSSSLNLARPLREHHRLAFPLLGPTFSAMRIEADATLISSSGWAHGVQTSGRKIVYCHAPARWLYQPTRYIAGHGWLARAALRAGTPPLRAWDRRAALSADRYLVNSTAIRDQVKLVYGIDADVVHPPVTVDVNGPQRRLPFVPSEYVLCVARLQSYKNVDVLIDAMRRLPDAHLVVVGSGPHASLLEAAAGPNVTFVGEVSERVLRSLYANASALVGASYEDFGLTPIEAAAFGVPTVALRFGGYLDTVRHRITGLLFDDLTATSLAASLSTVLSHGWDRAPITAHANQFSEERFIQQLHAAVLGRETRHSTVVGAAPRALQRA